jgi:hypothetical protein
VFEQLFDEILRAAPIQAYIGSFRKVILQIAAGSLGSEDPPFLRLDLGGDVSIAIPPAAALLREDTAEKHPKIPVIHLVAKEE